MPGAWRFERAYGWALLAFATLPSRSEGLPNMVLESMAMQRALVVTDRVARTGVLTHERQGLVLRLQLGERTVINLFRRSRGGDQQKQPGLRIEVDQRRSAAVVSLEPNFDRLPPVVFALKQPAARLFQHKMSPAPVAQL